MVVVTKRHLEEALEGYPDAETQIRAFYKVVRTARWTKFLDVTASFSSADAVGWYVVFNILRNRYRLITVVRYAKMKNGQMTQGHVFIRSFLTHKEYDNPKQWDRRYGRQ